MEYRCRGATVGASPCVLRPVATRVHAIINNRPHSRFVPAIRHFMHAFFEDDGALKAGTILADNDTSLQIEAATGKRLKVRADKVLLRFANPRPQALLDASERLAAELDPDFLWTVAGDDEIDFEALAADYHGRPPTAPEAASMARFLHEHPMYFYRRGRGRWQPAPKASLSAALAGLEKKRKEAEKVRVWTDALKAKS